METNCRPYNEHTNGLKNSIDSDLSNKNRKTDKEGGNTGEY